jgi:hypothetical protein
MHEQHAEFCIRFEKDEISEIKDLVGRGDRAAGLDLAISALKQKTVNFINRRGGSGHKGKILIAGHARIGKTILASTLAARLNGAYMSTDNLRQIFYDIEDDAERLDFRMRCYHSIFGLDFNGLIVEGNDFISENLHRHRGKWPVSIKIVRDLVEAVPDLSPVVVGNSYSSVRAKLDAMDYWRGNGKCWTVRRDAEEIPIIATNTIRVSRRLKRLAEEADINYFDLRPEVFAYDIALCVHSIIFPGTAQARSPLRPDLLRPPSRPPRRFSFTRDDDSLTETARSLSNLLQRAQPVLAASIPVDSNSPDNCILFFSLCDGTDRALICRGAGTDFSSAWHDGSRRCHYEVERRNLTVRWLRVDRVTAVEALTWAEVNARLAFTRRNYFRHGLALDAALHCAFLEQELSAHGMLFPGRTKAEAGLNEQNFLTRMRERFGQDFPDFSENTPVWLFAHEGAFVSDDPSVAQLPGGAQAPLVLPGPVDTTANWRDPGCLNAGRRQVGSLNADQVLALINSGASHLARQVKTDGEFIFGHFPCFGRTIPSYNALCHASSLYSMLEAWELTRDDALLGAIRRALEYLTNKLIRRYPQTDGRILAFNVDINDEVKLGANAVSLLALIKYDELIDDSRHRPLMEQLALGIASMQDASSGKFVHVLHAEDLSIKDDFRVIYYDGEAAFGLTRLYGLTRDARWLAIAETAMDFYIRAKHWRHHDHWLSCFATEITLYKPEERYFRFGVQNIEGCLDTILARETTDPALLELAIAFGAMLRRVQQDHPHLLHVLGSFDVNKLNRALHHRAHYLLNGVFWPELAMYYANPASVIGSFFIRHHGFRVRIDDVERYLAAFAAYWRMLRRDGGAAAADEFAPRGGVVAAAP